LSPAASLFRFLFDTTIKSPDENSGFIESDKTTKKDRFKKLFSSSSFNKTVTKISANVAARKLVRNTSLIALSFV
jgi:hypothetical protein